MRYARCLPTYIRWTERHRLGKQPRREILFHTVTFLRSSYATFASASEGIRALVSVKSPISVVVDALDLLSKMACGESSTKRARLGVDTHRRQIRNYSDHCYPSNLSVIRKIWWMARNHLWSTRFVLTSSRIILMPVS